MLFHSHDSLKSGRFCLIKQPLIRMVRLKCSRTQPCVSCIKSGDKDTCSFVAQESRGSSSSLGSKAKSALESRIDRLEAALASAMANNFRGTSSTTNSEQSSNSPQSTEYQNSDDAVNILEDHGVDALSGSLGLMKIDQDQTTHYLGGSHWVSIISEVLIIPQLNGIVG